MASVNSQTKQVTHKPNRTHRSQTGLLQQNMWRICELMDDGEDVKEEAVSVEEEADGVENGLSGRIGSKISEEANLPHASELT